MNEDPRQVIDESAEILQIKINYISLDDQPREIKKFNFHQQ